MIVISSSWGTKMTNQTAAHTERLKVISGPTELFIGLGFDVQHNEHCKGWRWHLYMQDSELRFQAVQAGAAKIIADLRAQRAAA